MCHISARRTFLSSSVYGWLGAILFFLVAGRVVGETALETNRFSTRYWLREDGLPQNTVTAVVQTRDGYIWLGTYNGLARFDGVRFTEFASGSTPGLASSRVTSLFEDKNNALWIGHEGGELTRYAGGKFEIQPVKAPWHHGKIIGIAADESGDIWLQNDEGLLARERDGLILTPETGALENVVELTRNAHGTIWTGRNGRVSILHQGTLIPLAMESGATNTFITGIGASRDGGLWMVADGRLRKWKDGDWREERGLETFGEAPFLQLMERTDGTLVGATSDHGILMIPVTGGILPFNRATGFHSDWAVALCEDREGGLWVGTGGSGLALVRKSCLQNISPPDGWQGRAILSVCGDHNGALWVGTEGVGLYRFEDGSWTNYTVTNGLANPYVWSLAEDTAGNFWAGTWGAGLFVRHGEHFDPAPGLEQVTMPMTALLPARQGGLWIGTGTGLLRYDASATISWFGNQETMAKNDVRCVLEDSKGAVWFGTAGEGLFRLQEGQLKSFGKAEGLSANFIQCLREDAGGAIWVGTFGGGLCRFKAGRFATISEPQGLSDNVICDIEDDGHGNFWMSSYNGILRVSKAELDQCADGLKNSVQCFNYGMSDGMPTLECSGGLQPAGCKTEDGSLWFATSRGLVAVNPLDIKNNPLPPPVVIENLLVDGENSAGEFAPLPKLKIPPGRHRLEFKYAGLSFAAPEKVRFKHRLDGLDSNWIDAGSDRTADYNYIPPGNYVFRVIACNNDGVWSMPGASLAFTVLPYFWQTAWFRALGLSGTVLLTSAGVWYGTRRRMRLKLERVERLRALERERTRIAKDIHDDLGASLTRINLMSQSAQRGMDDVPLTMKNLDQICTTARQLTRAMDEIVWAVDPQHDTLDSLANYLGKLIHELLGESGIRCRLDFPLNLPAWPVTAEVRHNLFLAFKEALHNVLKHSGASEVQISFALEPAAFSVSITDNGRGFDPAAKSAKPYPHRNGLVNMLQRLQEIGGRCEIQSECGHGTRVDFFLPVKVVAR